MLKQWLNKQASDPIGICFSDEEVSLIELGDAFKVKLANTWYGDGLVELGKYVSTHGLTHRPCVAVIANAHYQCHLIEKPNVAANEMRAAIQWRLSDLMESNVDNLAFDYFEVASAKDAYLYVVTIEKNKLEQIISVMTGAKLKPVRIEIAECALAQLYCEAHTKVTLPKVIIHQVHDKIHCQIIKGTDVLFVRQVEMPATDDVNQLCHELALIIQRSLDYCTSNLMDLSNALILLEPNEVFESTKSKLQDILGLQVESLYKLSVVQLAEPSYALLAASGALARRP